MSFLTIRVNFLGLKANRPDTSDGLTIKIIAVLGRTFRRHCRIVVVLATDLADCAGRRRLQDANLEGQAAWPN